MQYVAYIEETATGYSAYLPDVPGCVAASDTLAGVQRLLGEALDLHLRGLIEDGEPLPVNRTSSYAVSAPDDLMLCG